ncbi:MAG: DinB family protein [Vicinamibacterales bacterium]
MATLISRPQPGEYADFYAGYVKAIEHERDAIVALERQLPALRAIESLTPERASFRYADGKWSVRQVVGHMADAERIFTYRLLCIARSDETPLPSFDENQYANTSNADTREIGALGAELVAIRESALALVRGLDEFSLGRIGTASGKPVSVRALAFITAGHAAHHLRILRERYRVELPNPD